MATENKLPAKLARPRLHGVIERERLFALLDAERERPLVWIEGPPGAGKTTLVTTYLARDRVTTLWFRVDDGDSDPATFFSYLAQAVAALRPKRKLNLPALTPEYLMDLPGFARRYFRKLFAALPANSALVLDGYEAAAGGVLDDIVNIAVAEVPQGVRLLVTSRAAPPAALGHLAAKGALAGVSWDDLRLSPAEADAIAGEGRRAESESIETLHTLSDGWAAGFVVLLDHVRNAGGLQQHDPGALRGSLFAYFVNEMFARADKATRSVLIRTAVLSGFTGSLAEELCPGMQADTILARLYRQHYFLDRSMGEEPVYRYHALFRDFLLEQGRALLEPQERKELLVQAASLLVAHGQQEDAAALFFEAGAWHDAARSWCELAPRLMERGRNATLDKGISALPEQVIGEVPWLSFWLGMARLPFAPPAGRALLETAYAQFDAVGDSTGCLLACGGILDSYFLDWGDKRPADPWGKALQVLMRREGVFPSVDAEVRALASMFVLIFRAANHLTLVEEAWERAFVLLARLDEPIQRVALANFAGCICIFRGDWARMRTLVADIDASPNLSTVPPVHLIIWLVTKSVCLLHSGALAQSYAAIAQAEALAESNGVRILDGFIAGNGATTALNAGDVARAEVYADKMRAALNPARILDGAFHDWTRSALALARGDATAALKIARAAVEKSLACGAATAVAQNRCLVAQALLDLGQTAAALDEANEILAIATPSRLRVFEHTGLLLKSVALRRTGADVEALAMLSAALVTGRESDYAVFFAWVPAHFLQELFGIALEAKIETAYVRSIIRRLNVPPPDPEPDAWPWPVKVRTLGRFAVLKDYQPLHFTGKAQRKPMELLKALIGLGGHEVPIDTLVQVLWPEPREGDSHKAFDITVHRLRKLLGHDAAIVITDRRVTLNPDVVWLDVRSVERLLARVAPAQPGASTALADLTEAVPNLLDLYRGAFLADESDAPWLLATRDRLAAQFRRFVLRLGEHFEHAGHWADAANLYERGVEIDTLAETLYRRLMVCLHRQGQYAEAIEVFRRCRKMLAVVLGVKPSRETDEVYQQVLSAATN
jgi:ATP/maltotriose-dependent transcriptional regulator MalT/DNA-binding SARP family transcriptional activator